MTVSSDQAFDAIYHGDVDKLNSLIAHGLGVESRFGDDKWNLLHLALVSLTDPPNCGVLRHLIDLGVDVNARDQYLWTPLHFAVRTGCVDAVRLLVQAGADVGVPNGEGLTPLHLCVTQPSCNLAIVETLLSAGSNPHADHGAGTPWRYINRAAGSDLEHIRVLFEEYEKNRQKKGETTSPEKRCGKEGEGLLP